MISLGRKVGTKMVNKLVRVDKKFYNMIRRVNNERKSRGLKKLSARRITARLAVKYMKSGAMIEDEFIRF